MGLFGLERKRLMGFDECIYLNKMCLEDKARIFSSAPGFERQWAQPETQEVPIEHEEKFL